MRLQNRVAVVTGGGSGIGGEICRALAREGALVAVTDLRQEAAEAVAAQIQGSKIGPFLDCTDVIWDRSLHINLTGTFIGCQVAIRSMLPRRRGVIINMSSQSGKTGNSHFAAYCASKFGVIGLTQSLAIEFARHGIRVNAICPGVVFTPMWDEIKHDYARKRDMNPEDVRDYMADKIPMGRLCTEEDVALTAVFLASDDAAYITGQAINLAGGMVMH